MECTICFEKFFMPNTKEECKKFIEGNLDINQNRHKELMRLWSLIVTPSYNTTHKCYIPNCECIICDWCWTRIRYRGKDSTDATLDDIPSIYDYFVCPCCRNIDWKYYMTNVFRELQIRVLGKEEFHKLMCEKMFTKKPIFA